MKLEKLLDLTLREILENYCAVNNLECGYYYGVFHVNDIEQILKEYNINEEYPEAFNIENLIPDELIVSFEEPIGNYSKLEKIMRNLGITKKNGELK